MSDLSKAIDYLLEQDDDFPIDMGDPTDTEGMTPHVAFMYTRNVFGGRWPEAEKIILQSPTYAYLYAKHLVGGRWPEAEEAIIQKRDSWAAYLYAYGVIKGRWPEAESVIMEDPDNAYRYATLVMGERWPEAEKFIKQDSYIWNRYKGVFLDLDEELLREQDDDFPIDMGDPTNPEDMTPEEIYEYAKDVIRGRWPEAEPYLVTDDMYWAAKYARDVIEDRWAEFESEFDKNEIAATWYVQLVLFWVFPLGLGRDGVEDIRIYPNIWAEYKEEFGVEDD